MTAPSHGPCDFCDIVAGQEPARVVWRNPEALAFLPLNPATTGHVLVIPRRHYSTILDMDDAAARSLGAAVRVVAKGLCAALGPDGLNVIQSNGTAATQTIDHVHAHLVPRWADDNMPDIWPEKSPTAAADLDAIARTLREEFAENE